MGNFTIGKTVKSFNVKNYGTITVYMEYFPNSYEGPIKPSSSKDDRAFLYFYPGDLTSHFEDAINNNSEANFNTPVESLGQLWVSPLGCPPVSSSLNSLYISHCNVKDKVLQDYIFSSLMHLFQKMPSHANIGFFSVGTPKHLLELAESKGCAVTNNLRVSPPCWFLFDKTDLTKMLQVLP